MKSIRWIVASAFVSVFAAACAVGTPGQDESQGPDGPQDEASVAEAEQPLSGTIRTTVYYSDPGLNNQVGYCVFRTCVPKGTTCYGDQTAYKEVFVDPCD